VGSASTGKALYSPSGMTGSTVPVVTRLGGRCFVLWMISGLTADIRHNGVVWALGPCGNQGSERSSNMLSVTWPVASRA
jgi:hypothetical protein